MGAVVPIGVDDEAVSLHGHDIAGRGAELNTRGKMTTDRHIYDRRIGDASSAVFAPGVIELPSRAIPAQRYGRAGGLPRERVHENIDQRAILVTLGIDKLVAAREVAPHGAA